MTLETRRAVGGPAESPSTTATTFILPSYNLIHVYRFHLGVASDQWLGSFTIAPRLFCALFLQRKAAIWRSFNTHRRGPLQRYEAVKYIVDAVLFTNLARALHFLHHQNDILQYASFTGNFPEK
jgi:hypothetical protein